MTAPDAAWDGVAAAATQWTAGRGIVLRDAVLLLPFTQLLPPARRAFGRRGGWQPRIETTRTLAAALGPAAAPLPGQLSFDAGVDRLSAQRMLREQTLGAAWARADPLGFERGAAALVATAQAMAQAAAALPPREREPHWAQARQRFMPLAGLGERQRWLARIALEWAAQAPEPATDRLFALAPAAWIALQAGGPDVLLAALMGAASTTTACLVLDADTPAPAPTARPSDVPVVALCSSFEDEAQCAAAQVLVHLARGEHPIALIGQDRLLVRRVRALLERRQVPLADETGWALSTTRAAAQVMLLLRAAAPGAGTDTLFDWLKSLPAWPGRAHAAAEVRRLERHCRRHAVARIEDLDRAALDDAIAPFWAVLRAELARLRGTHRPVARWLEQLAAALVGCGARAVLQADEAGRSVLAALRFDTPPPDPSATTALSLHEFTTWVDAVLEQSAFLPSAPAGEARVVITPLARVMLRPFAALVCPGADDRHLGARPAPHPLLGEADLALFGLPTAEVRQQREALAFAQALRFARVTFLRRRADGPEPLADSPLLQRLALALGHERRGFAPWADPRVRLERPRRPVQRPAPQAAALLPAQLSASAAEALRDCPYRFFTRHLLGLREDDELEADIEKRDYGTWLHAVLNDFHTTRAAPESAVAERARLHELAAAAQARLGLGDDEFLPFAASFAALVPRYIAWLHARDAAGAIWQAGEQRRAVRPDALGGIELTGIIDRIDRHGTAGALELIDYKTGSADDLKAKVREPLEDTQLAFYAALEAPHTAGVPLQAMYLALDGSKRIEAIVHPDVEADAAVLVRELGSEFARLRAGAGLPALGEPPVCSHCEARGLCRRDHWQQGGG